MHTYHIQRLLCLLCTLRPYSFSAHNNNKEKQTTNSMQSSSITMTHNVPLTQTTNSPTRERKVCFSRKACQTHLIESHYDFNEDELENIWYSSDDYRRIRSKNKRMQQMIKDRIFVLEDDKHFCFRGIIHEQLRRRRLAHRQQALRSLCYEQQQQYITGVADAERLRSVLVLCSKAATEEAIVQAEEDRLAVLDRVEAPARKVGTQEMSTLASALAFQMNYDNPAASEHSRPPVCNDSDQLVNLLDGALAILEVR